MDEELQKRNTDCVYFLASPLTCKKGLDCEYRHSEMARLNPRDCWYWSAGGCLNPTCAFRHPPMGGNTEASSESAALHNQSNVSVNKTDVPCYFYFNGYCHKGDKCFFMHTSVDGANAWKSSKTASSLPNGLAMEKKTSAGSETGSAPVGTHFISSETAAREPTEVKITQKEDLHQSASAPLNVSEKSASTHISVSAFEETAAINSEDSSLRAEGFDRSPSLVSIDQSSEHQLVEHIEGEDWLESSPGFDVLVADDSEKLGYEDDPEYNEGRGLNHQFMGYDCEDHPFEYDPEFPAYEQGMHDSYEHEHEHAYDYVREDRIRPEERMFDDCLTRKRSFSPIKLAYGDQLRVDLRDRLKRRRGVIGDSGNHFPRRTHSSRLIGRSRERSRQNPYGRSGSKVENNIVGSQTWSMHRFKDKKLGNRRFLPSDVISKKRRFNEEANVFSGPKTLAQIKEEKKKGQENEYYFGKTELPERTVLEDFRGPKPLSEILKDKRRLRSTVHSNN